MVVVWFGFFVCNPGRPRSGSLDQADPELTETCLCLCLLLPSAGLKEYATTPSYISFSLTENITYKIQPFYQIEVVYVVNTSLQLRYFDIYQFKLTI